jgi:Tfp pilus assembly protein PilZ
MVGDTSFASYIINISVDGVFIESNDRFSIGQRIRMAFKLPNAPNPLELKGQINRNGFQGFGVNFLDLNQDQQEIIRAYITSN